MAKKEFTKTSKMLMWMCLGLEAASHFLATPKELQRRARKGNMFKSTVSFNNLYYYLLRKNLIKLVDKNNEKFVRITKKGELAVLLAKSKIEKSNKWDGKWRVIIFDIPEASRKVRDYFRKLLNTYGFKMLQASVFISPNPLNRQAVEYLKEKGLMQFIRILKVEEMDNDMDLIKYFCLKKS